MTSDARTALGRLGEELAAAHLERLGWRIVVRNHHTRVGELDLVALDGDALVFCEVKTCRLGRALPWDSLHERKRARVRKVAGCWLNSYRPRPRFATMRFDAIGIIVDGDGALVRLDHLRAAF